MLRRSLWHQDLTVFNVAYFSFCLNLIVFPYILLFKKIDDGCEVSVVICSFFRLYSFKAYKRSSLVVHWLRIQHHHCSSLGCGSDLIPGPGTSTFHGCGKKKKKKRKEKKKEKKEKKRKKKRTYKTQILFLAPE